MMGARLGRLVRLLRPGGWFAVEAAPARGQSVTWSFGWPTAARWGNLLNAGCRRAWTPAHGTEKATFWVDQQLALRIEQ